MSGHFI